MVTKPFSVLDIGGFDSKSKNWLTGDTTTFEGSRIEAITSKFGLQQIIDEPTHFQGKSTSCIDLTFASQSSLVIGYHLLNSISKSIIHHLVNMKYVILEKLLEVISRG